jgi:three-Cys-motif partner protein
MAEKPYEWAQGANLGEHSHRKHKILREYVFDYVTVRCQLPQQKRFRLAIVDGFAGGGRYASGAAGSPLIFIEGLRRAITALNAHRAVQELGSIEIECLLILNDANREAIEALKTNVAPAQADVRQNCPKLHLRVEYLNDCFEIAYPKIKRLLEFGHYRNALFNLDQCGHSCVERKTILDIMRSYQAVEIFYTFSIGSLLAFLHKNDPERLQAQFSHIGLRSGDLQALDGLMSQKEWLGAAERIVFNAFEACARFVSPFSINNPGGWRYWFIHFANRCRARQVYNSILHDNASLQAHFGRSGLNMLSYDPAHEGMLYLFDDIGREAAKNQLLEDIPRMLAESGEAMAVSDFYGSIYNITPAHADDVRSAMIGNPDLEVITPAGGRRRKANAIAEGDVLKLKPQRSFFPMFFGAGMKRDK